MEKNQKRPPRYLQRDLREKSWYAQCYYAKIRAMWDGKASAVEYTKWAMGDERWCLLVYLRTDPIFYAAVADNPWELVSDREDEYLKMRRRDRKELLHDLMLALGCGWNLRTLPARYRKALDRVPEFKRALP